MKVSEIFKLVPIGENIIGVVARDVLPSALRIIRIGNLEYKIYPTPEAIAFVRDALKKSDSDKTTFVYGPDIDMIESGGVDECVAILVQSIGECVDECSVDDIVLVRMDRLSVIPFTINDVEGFEGCIVQFDCDDVISIIEKNSPESEEKPTPEGMVRSFLESIGFVKVKMPESISGLRELFASHAEQAKKCDDQRPAKITTPDDCADCKSIQLCSAIGNTPLYSYHAVSKLRSWYENIENLCVGSPYHVTFLRRTSNAVGSTEHPYERFTRELVFQGIHTKNDPENSRVAGYISFKNILGKLVNIDIGLIESIDKI
jgi:ferredoxin